MSAPPLSWNINGLYFDAWLTLNHQTSSTITQHPVETGAAISDHNFINPRRFSFEVGETDVVARPLVQGSGTRSVNAYQAIVALEYSRQLLTLVSKYGTFNNILIESIDVRDDYRTKNAMKATINLVEVRLAQTRFTQVSANIPAVDQTNRGQVNSQSLAAQFTNQAVSWLGSLFR